MNQSLSRKQFEGALDGTVQDFVYGFGALSAIINSGAMADNLKMDELKKAIDDFGAARRVRLTGEASFR